MENALDRASIFCEGLDHPEGIAVHVDGSIWAGGEAGQIYRVSSDGGKVTEVANTGGFILGVAFNQAGNKLAICDLGHKCVWIMDVGSKRMSKLEPLISGHRFNIPNYPVYDLAGNLYVSESGAFREITGKILRFNIDGQDEVWHNGPFNFANGLAIGPDAKYVYVVCSWLPGVERIQILADGTAGVREVFCTLPRTVPDGIAFDDHGSLFVSCYTPNVIYRVEPDRTTTVFAEDWEGHTLANPTNIAFRKGASTELFVSSLGRWHLTKIDMR